MNIALVDYGAGNLTSVRKGLAAAGAEVTSPATPADLAAAPGIVVPGVGNFAATSALDLAWRAALMNAVARGTPLLGICLGMQWLFGGSEEAPDLPGLELLPGRCTRLAGTAGDGATLKVPHVGWNSLQVRRASRILDGVPNGGYVYFTHSYAAPVTGDCVAATEHGVAFASVVERDRTSGVQFHPEKSGDLGLRMLRNFIDLVRATTS